MISAGARGDSVQAYLSIPGITGESSPPGFADAIAITSFSFKSHEFAVTKVIDKATPGLAVAVATGKSFPTATLVSFAGSSSTPSAEFNFDGVIAAQQSIIGTTESDSFAFANPSSPFLDQTYLDLPGQGLIQLRSLTVGANQLTVVAQNLGTIFPTSGTTFAGGAGAVFQCD